uniref:Uncharacterized protein n=1 Tax=Anguilla anguilla TaxID=7936 RepID=A0A0E9V4T2_ANGAN
MASKEGAGCFTRESQPKAKANNPSRFSPNATVFLYWGRLPQRACTDSTIAPYRFSHSLLTLCVCL